MNQSPSNPIIVKRAPPRHTVVPPAELDLHRLPATRHPFPARTAPPSPRARSAAAPYGTTRKQKSLGEHRAYVVDCAACIEPWLVNVPEHELDGRRALEGKLLELGHKFWHGKHALTGHDVRVTRTV